ncbi:hypothetical protein FWH09_01215 [Candidatus Saccharibacteria bacterium]|nr:hypothetical protein [Candidatus Saccharibacteria bacterium]
MFLDCDDCLRDATTLAFILSQISTHKDTDLFRLGTFRELDDGSFTPIDCTNETWLHGKIVRRDFLRQNNIRFSEELMCNEDIYWNLRLSTFSPKTINIPTEVYFWRNNPDSLTRALGAEDFIARYFHEYIKARHYGLRDGKPMSDGTANRIIQTSVYSFVIINSSDMNKRPEFKALAEEAFRAFIKDYRYIFDQHNQPEKIEPYFLSMIQAHLGKLQYRISLFDWLDSITPKDYHKPEKAKKSK